MVEGQSFKLKKLVSNLTMERKKKVRKEANILKSK